MRLTLESSAKLLSDSGILANNELDSLAYSLAAEWSWRHFYDGA
jgi:hypothetical protein